MLFVKEQLKLLIFKKTKKGIVVLKKRGVDWRSREAGRAAFDKERGGAARDGKKARKEKRPLPGL